MSLRLTLAFAFASLVPLAAHAQDDVGDDPEGAEESVAQAEAPDAVPAAIEDEPRLIFGFDGAVIFPLASPHLEALWPGPTFAIAAHASVTKWLMPTLRLRGAILADQAQSNAFPDPGVGTLLQGMGGSSVSPPRDRAPRGGSARDVHLGRGGCGIGLWNGRWQPIFEATIGFDFEAGPVDLGPVVHFTHVLPTSAGDGPDAFLLSVGLEVLLNDARGPAASH